MDLTGTYTPEGFWEFQPYPKLKPAAQALYDRVRAGAAAGRTVNDVTGDCWPPGMPIIMTRVWPFHVIALEDGDRDGVQLPEPGALDLPGRT